MLTSARLRPKTGMRSAICTSLLPGAKWPCRAQIPALFGHWRKRWIKGCGRASVYQDDARYRDNLDATFGRLSQPNGFSATLQETVGGQNAYSVVGQVISYMLRLAFFTIRDRRGHRAQAHGQPRARGAAFLDTA